MVPKGWPVEGLTPAQSAAREAFEEAGVRGTITDTAPLGTYSHRKKIAGVRTTLLVGLFALRVTEELEAWPERRERRRGWFDPATAAGRVDDPGLAALLEMAAHTLEPLAL